MKSYLLILCLLLCARPDAVAQSSRAFSKANSTVSAGIGLGNIWKTFLEDVYTYPSNTYKVTSKGTFTLIYEYGFTRHISAGIVIGYSRVVGDFNGYGQGFSETLTNFSILGRGNYHFGKFEKFDPYIGGGLGYYQFEYHNNKPGIINSKVPGSFGYSLQLGAHYYFLPHLGAYAEAGYVGGSLGQVGLSYKF